MEQVWVWERTIRPKILADSSPLGVFRCREAYLASPLPRESFGSPSTLNFEKVTYLLWQFQGGREKGITPEICRSGWCEVRRLPSVVLYDCTWEWALLREPMLRLPVPPEVHLPLEAFSTQVAPEGLGSLCACGCG